MSLEKIDSLLKKLSEGDTAAPHDVLAADPDYKSVTPREQNFLQNFLGTVTGNNSNDRMNFHNDVKSYGYKNAAKLTKLFAKHYPAFSASSQKSEASARGVDWAEFNNFITTSVDKLSDVRDEHSSIDGSLMKFGSALVDLGAAIDLLHDLPDIRADKSRTLRNVSDAVISVGNDLMSLAHTSQHPDGTDRIREP